MTRARHTTMGFAARLLCVLGMGWLSQAALAETACLFTTVAGVGFGAYDVFSERPNNQGVGSIGIDCKGAGNTVFDVSLSTGQSQSYVTRTLRAGANLLNYNLYTSAGRTQVWGDGSGASSVMQVQKNKPVALDIFGQIPAGQDVAVGSYSDAIVVTVNF